MDNRTLAQRIAIIGGGVAGLSAAHRLIELSQQQGQNIEVTLFEASSRLGGVVGTERIGDYLVDVGADSFLTNKPGAVQLCQRLGIADRLVPTDKRYRGAFVLYEGRPVPVPEGFQLLSPTAIWPVITSPLLSVWGKVRMLMEWFVPARRDLIDESLADFTRRRFGREALERLVQPLVGGIYTSDPEKLSLAATMPRFLEMERDYGSLMRAVLFKRQVRTDSSRSSSNGSSSSEADTSSGARYGLFAGLAGGIDDLINPLRNFVHAHCKVRLNCPVATISRLNSTVTESTDAGHETGYRLQLTDGSYQQFASVVVASSSMRAASLLDSLDTSLAAVLSEIEYASSALIVTGHRLEDIRHPLDSFGLVVPHRERRKILAVSFSSRKFPDRAPAGRVLLRTFVGGALQPELYEQTDTEMIETVRSELADIFGVRGEPDFARVYRYPRAMPQYHVGHRARISQIESLVAQYHGLALAGNAYRGVGLPDVITSGEQAAESVIRQLAESAQPHLPRGGGLRAFAPES